MSLLTWPGFDLSNASQRLRSGLAPLHISQLTLQEVSGNSVVSLGRHSAVARVAYRHGLFRELLVVQGRDPSAPDEVLVPQPLAAALGIAPGARISLSQDATTSATVSGVYWAARGRDPLVYARHRLLSSPSSAPLLTTSAGFDALTRSFGQTNGIAMEWDAEPSFSGLRVADLRALALREEESGARIRATLGGTTVSSDLSSLIPGAERAVAVGLAPIYVIAAEVALVGLGVLLGIGLLKLERQSFELAVLTTRGARMSELVTMQAGEAAIAASVALPLSLLAAVGLALVARAAHGPALPGTLFPIGLNARAVQVALGGVTLGALALVVVSLPRLRHTVIQERRWLSRSKRGVWARLPYELVPLLLGAAALAELRRHHLGGSGTGLDPLALAAPTLLLLGVAALAARLLLAGARKLDRVAKRVRRPSAYLALRRLSRSGSTAWLALLLVLSAALFAFATSLRTTELTRNQDVARAQVGADWSLLVGWPAQGVASAERLGSAATLAFYGSAAASSAPALWLATVIGVDPASYAGAGWWQARDASLPLPSLLSRLSAPPTRDGPAAWSADPSASGERFDGEGLAPVGSALVVERDVLRSLPRRTAARNQNVSGARRRCVSAPFHHGQRITAGGGAPASPSQGSSCLLTPCPVGRRRRASGRPLRPGAACKPAEPRSASCLWGRGSFRRRSRFHRAGRSEVSLPRLNPCRF